MPQSCGFTSPEGQGVLLEPGSGPEGGAVHGTMPALVLLLWLKDDASSDRTVSALSPF